jgi:hypothetical protein
MKLKHILSHAFILVLAAALTACGASSNSEATTEVSGNVTLNGTPVKDGTVTFEASPPNGMPPGPATITNGTYKGKASVGTKIVRISSPQAVPGKKGPMDLPVLEDSIPAKFNTESQEKAEIKPGANTIDFDLKS